MSDTRTKSDKELTFDEFKEGLSSLFKVLKVLGMVLFCFKKDFRGFMKIFAFFFQGVQSG